MSEIKLNTIEEAIEDFREGKFLIVVDDEDRENEGDFIIAAEKITPEKVNFMLKNGRGVLCAPITEERCQELELDMQVANNTSLLGTPCRSENQPVRSGPSGTYQPASCPFTWCVAPCRTYRSSC